MGSFLLGNAFPTACMYCKRPWMISVRPSHLPLYLKDSAFYSSLHVDDEEVSIPIGCYKADVCVADTTQLDELLCTLRFWGVDRIPETVVKYVVRSPRGEWEHVMETYRRDLPFVEDLLRVVECKREGQVCKAVIIGNLEIVSCLLSELYPVEFNPNLFNRRNTSAVDIAAMNGRLDILKLLHHHCCRWYEETAKAAASGDHIGCLKYLIETGCPMMPDLVNYAFASGSIECLRYLHETAGCKWAVPRSRHSRRGGTADSVPAVRTGARLPGRS